MRSPRAATAPTSLAVLALLAGGLTACSGPDERQTSAQAYADRLAAGLGAADLTGRDVTGVPDPTAALAATLGDLADRLPDEGGVSAGPVRVEETRAVVPLTWRWQLAGETWRYRTRAVLIPATTADGDQRTDGEGRPQWTAAWRPAWVHPGLAADDSLDVVTQTADRGDILGADDEPIVVSRDVVRLGVDKTRLDGADAARSARRVARIVDVEAAPYAAQVAAAGEQAFVPALTLRADEAGRLVRRVESVPGGLAFATSEPLAPTADFAAPLIGRVGPVTAEILEESDGALSPDDVVGLSGLQARYDDRLRGRDGVVVRRVSAQDADDVEALFDVTPRAGRPLRLTLEVQLQQQAQQILGEVPGSAGATALVAIRPSDGAVLAAASGGADGLATATFGAEPPGSTFKVVSALALLRSGLTPDSPLACPAETVVDGRSFGNYDGYPSSSLGRIDLRTALAQSCNTAFIGARDRIADGDLVDAAAALGFGVDHDMGYPVSFGSIPEPAGATEAAADLIGQGRVTASPVVMAAVAASVQAGRAVLPRLVDGVEVTPIEPAAPVTRAEQRALQSMMRSVVADGSGQVLAAAGATGAKTGTAQFGEAGPGGELPTHAWMIATRGDLAVAAYVENGDSGSGTAGPLLAQLLDAARR